MSYIHPHDSSRRWTSIGAVLVLHVALVYALLHGLARPPQKIALAPLETNIIEELNPRATPPAALQPPLTHPANRPSPSFVPLPDVRLDVPTPPDAITAFSHDPPPVDVPAPIAALVPVPQPVFAPTQPVRTAAVVNARHCEKPQYPRESLHDNETGIVVLQFLIGTDGITLESRIEKSSGFRRLDEAARRALSLCRFKPGTEDGKPVQSWATIEYLWKVED